MVRTRHPADGLSRDTHSAAGPSMAASNDLYGSFMRLEPVTVVDIGQGSVTDAAVMPRGLDGSTSIRDATIPITKFANGIRPVGIVVALPTLPTSDYPPGSYVYLTGIGGARGTLWKNEANVWLRAVGAGDIEANSITAGQIAAGAISATEIATGAITSSKILVSSDANNLIKNGGFEEFTGVHGVYAYPPLLPGWTSLNAAVTSSASWSTNVKSGVNIAILKSGNGTFQYGSLLQWVPVRQGMTYRLSGWAWKSVPGGQSAQIIAHSYDKNQALVSWNVMTAVTTTLNTPQYGEAIWKIPSGVAMLRVEARWVLAPTTGEIFAFEDVVLEELPAAFTNTNATVSIDNTGITILDGALVIEDEYGSSAATASGFAGDWASFIVNGIYNGSFLHGQVGTLPAGRTSGLPYWFCTTSSATLSYFADSSTVGFGIKCIWSALAGYATVYSDPIPIQAFQWYSLTWTYEANVVAGSVKVQPSFLWYDADSVYLGSSTLAFDDTVSSVTEREGPQDAAKAPYQAYYCRVYFKFNQATTHNTSNWVKLHGVTFKTANHVLSPQRYSDAGYVYTAPGGAYPRFDPGDTDNLSLVEMGTTSAVTLYGLRAPGFGKRILTLMVYGAYSVTIKHDSASATNVSERFYTPGGVDFVVPMFGSATLYYNARNSRWFILSK